MGKTRSPFCPRYLEKRRAVIILTIHRILHAGYQIADQDHDLIFDPVLTEPFSGNCFSYPRSQFETTALKSLEISAIFISHVHEDHFCLRSLSLFNRDIPVYIFAEDPEAKDLIHKVGFPTVHLLNLEQTYQIGQFQVTPKRALDENLDCFFSIRHGDVNILNVVDAWIHPDSLPALQQQAPWNLVLWPFQNMQEIEVLCPEISNTSAEEIFDIPEELKSDLLALQPQTLIPSSCQFKFEDWSWYNHKYFPISYKSFSAQIKNLLPTTKVQRLDPGMGLSWTQKAWTKTEGLSWVKRFCGSDSDESNDYKFDRRAQIPSTDKVSQNFPKQTDQEINQVLQFIKTDMLSLLKQQKEDLHPYFQQIGVWQLRLCTCDGSAIEIQIELPSFQIIQATTSELSLPATRSKKPQPILWTTSIPFWTAFKALTESASLSSSYLRVNESLSPEQRNKLPDDISPLDDLLIRTLFAQSSLAFQKNQLNELLTCGESWR